MRVVRNYTDEFRSDAVNLLRRSDRSLRQVAADLGVNHWTLRDWYNKDEMARKTKKVTGPRSIAGPKDVQAKETVEQRFARLERENERLRKENDELRTDRAILKKAAAFFAKESE